MDDYKDRFERLKNKSKANAALPKAVMPKQVLVSAVPDTPPGTSPISNEIARTPLFSPIKKGERKILDKARLPSPNGIDLYYFGKELDMADQDVYLTALMLAKGAKPDTPVVINRSEFLKLIGRAKSGQAFKWLKDSFDRISTGRLFYDAPDESGSTPLLGMLRYDKSLETYYFTIPYESLKVFGYNAFGYVDMDKRFMIENKIELSKWLQSYAVSHQKGIHKVSVAYLKEWSGYGSKDWDFRIYLAEALDELVRVGIFERWTYVDENEKVEWLR